MCNESFTSVIRYGPYKMERQWLLEEKLTVQRLNFQTRWIACLIEFQKLWILLPLNSLIWLMANLRAKKMKQKFLFIFYFRLWTCKWYRKSIVVCSTTRWIVERKFSFLHKYRGLFCLFFFSFSFSAMYCRILGWRCQLSNLYIDSTVSFNSIASEKWPYNIDRWWKNVYIFDSFK